MTLPSSGAISLNEMNVEANNTTNTLCSLNDSDIRALIDKASGAEMSFNEWYGAQNTFSFTISSNTLKGTLTTLATAAGWDGNDLIDCTIASGVYVWSDSTSTAALIIDEAYATVTNNGYIMGQGGEGGKNTTGAQSNPTDGGPAINVTASNTTITNNSGAFIAGGGGGGGWFAFDNAQGDPKGLGGGGGAGGGTGGKGGTNNDAARAGASSPGTTGGAGAEAGGGRYTAGSEGWGSGGGRILPGTAHNTSSYTGGGAGGQAGTQGGGGGWGAAGSNGDSYGTTINGGAAGAAITGTARTLTNNGTVYGST